MDPALLTEKLRFSDLRIQIPRHRLPISQENPTILLQAPHRSLHPTNRPPQRRHNRAHKFLCHLTHPLQPRPPHHCRDHQTIHHQPTNSKLLANLQERRRARLRPQRVSRRGLRCEIPSRHQRLGPVGATPGLPPPLLRRSQDGGRV